MPAGRQASYFAGAARGPGAAASRACGRAPAAGPGALLGRRLRVALHTVPPLARPPWPAGGNKRDKQGSVAIRQPYLRVIGFQEDVLNGDTARRPTFT